MDDDEKERLRDKGRGEARTEVEAKMTSALLWGFGGAAVGGGLIISLFNLPAIAVLIPGGIAAFYGWNRVNWPRR
jgi:hypothetical protein